MAKDISIVVYLNMLITLPIHGWMGYQKIENLCIFWSFEVPPPESSGILEALHFFKSQLVLSLFLITILYLYYYLVDSCSAAHLYFRAMHQGNPAKRSYYTFLAKLQLVLLPILLSDRILAAIDVDFSSLDVFNFVVILVWKLFFIVYVGFLFDPERPTEIKLCTPTVHWPRRMRFHLPVVTPERGMSETSIPSKKLVPSPEGTITTIKATSISC